MNSYFASVEQQQNPSLRGKPIIVTGEGKRTIVIAASYEAKKYGIKTTMRIFEAERLCPSLVRVYGDGEKYASLQLHILSILEKYFRNIEIASIDEFYIDCTGISDWEKIREIAIKLKEDLKSEIGEFLKCSIGISLNKRMAKLASNIKKPDGLVVLTQEDLDNIIPNLQVGQISGIGRKIEEKLHSLGIYTFKDIRCFPEDILYRQFKNHLTQFLLESAYGIDSSPVVPYTKRPAPKSFSHEVTFPEDIADIEYLNKAIYSLIGKLVFRMKRKNMKGKGIGIHLRLKDMTYIAKNKQVGRYSDNSYFLYQQAKSILLSMFPLQIEVRQIGVSVFNTISSEDLPTELFQEDDTALINTLQEINTKFGQFTIAPLSVYNTKPLDRKIHGFYRLDN